MPKSMLFAGPKLRGDLLLVTAVIHVLALALPLALLHIYDRILPSQSYGTALVLVLGVGLAIVLEAFLRFGRVMLFSRFAARYEAQTYLGALESLLNADVQSVERRGAPAVIDALRSIGQVRDFWSGQAGAALYETPFALLYLALIAYIGGWLVAVPLVLFLCGVALAARWSRTIADLAGQAEERDWQRRALAWSSLSGLADIKSAGAEGQVAAIYRRLNASYMQRTASLETLQGWVRENAQAISQLATVLVVAWGAVEVVHGRLSTGALAACTMLVGRAVGPVMASLGYWAQLARISAAQAKVDDLLGTEIQGRSPTPVSGESAPIAVGELTLTAPGWFAGPLRIEAGEIVHVRSASATDASHLLSVIAGLTRDERIQVLLDGQPIERFARADYARAVALVTRHPALVPGSILNNLTLFDPRCNGEVKHFCELLGLQPYLDRLRHGVLTEVGLGKAEHLDEGISQRIALIRGLLRKPRILLLDHAASGLDLDGIKRLAEVLRSLQGNTTVLLVSHKEALVAACTRQMVIETGEVGA
ncbi:ABC transporter transmembrane domain-containing protein [Aquipseudomonas alcaligenes]|uniref:ABC-type bacteriocin/lantibiotic exporter, contains an N-terminal double-glycine peptidase domain n=1 Tax=Aquipseudomonas alcaligenes TaxID=43263 RepID=A0A1N6W9W8_AQUAC|nr:ABC transporter transmembrane domain-containing protein [Pseudomonas alcaligenes]SIQ86941.1 ABC-type bacteriocin/lantibiotic exporter, contains an N-terminal double-glycine peptidase domain [Pseudomonas alcaligenes]